MSFAGNSTALAAFALLGVSAPALAAIPSSTSGAVSALARCDRSQAARWSERLDREDPELAMLYRLAWLEAPRVDSQRPSRLPLSDRALWRWKPDAEIWSDERETGHENCQAPLARNFSELPLAVVRGQLSPRIPRYFSQRRALRSTLRRFALFEWMEGRKLAMPAASPAELALLPESERCEWRAVAALHAEPASSAELTEVSLACASRSSENPTLYSLVQTRAGDLFLRNGRAADALRSFESAVALMPRQDLAPALAYRIAVSGILSGAEDSLVIRAARSALLETSAEERAANEAFGSSPRAVSPLTPVLRASLSNLLCEHLAAATPSAALVGLKRVFTPATLVHHSIALTEGCETSDLSGLWQTLLRQGVSRDAEKARLLSLLIGVRVRDSNPASANPWIDELAALSRKSPYAASRALWNALPRSPQAAVLAARYRRRGQWLATDDLRFKRLGRAPTEPTGPLRVQTRSSDPTIRLPMAAVAEPLPIRAEVQAGFVAALREDLSR